MTLTQAKEALNRRAQYGEMSIAMCDAVCGAIDKALADNARMDEIIRRTATLVDQDCPDTGAYVDGHCGLPEAVGRVVGNILDHWYQLPADVATDPACDSLRVVIEKLTDVR